MKLGAIFLIAFVMVVGGFLLLWHLGVEPFQDYDEATYAEVTAEGLAAHHYISFSFLDRNYFNKPPLLFWLMDVSAELVPNPQTAARLPSALSGIVLIAVLIGLVYEASQNIFVAALAGAVLATTSSFIEPARQVRFDILVSLFIMAAVYAFLKAFEDRRWFLVFGAFIGLAILSKGPLAVFAIIAVLGIAVAYKRIKWLWDPYFWGGVGVCLLIAAPWHVYETIRFGWAFWEEYLQDQVLDRVGQALFNGPTNADYLGYLYSFASPWIVLYTAGVLTVPFLWKRMSIKVRALMLASIFGAAAVLGVCFISKTKAISYLIPLYPCMAVTISLVAYELAKFKQQGITTALIAAAVGASLIGFYFSVYNGFHINPYYKELTVLATEEKTIGDTLLAEHPQTFYIYDVTTLGSVMYYSHIVTPQWIGSTVPYRGSYVLFQTPELKQLQQAFPTMKLSVLYQGTQLSLGQVN